MAKRTRKKGCGTTEQQIARLEELVKPAGCRKAKELINTCESGVLKLAAKLLVQSEKQERGLGMRIETMLATMPKAKADEMRAGLLEAKNKTQAAD